MKLCNMSNKYWFEISMGLAKVLLTTKPVLLVIYELLKTT